MRKSTQCLIIENNGIGYEVVVPFTTFYALPEEKERVSLHIYTHVREDAFILFGFHTLLEKNIFLMLISVSGIGPKLAINILSGIGPDDLLEAMAQGDTLRLQAIPGVGKKTAERIALELKDKALEVRGDSEGRPTKTVIGKDKEVYDDAFSALLNLGYTAKSAKKALEKALAHTKDMNLEGLIKEALQSLI